MESLAFFSSKRYLSKRIPSFGPLHTTTLIIQYIQNVPALLQKKYHSPYGVRPPVCRERRWWWWLLLLFVVDQNPRDFLVRSVICGHMTLFFSGAISNLARHHEVSFSDKREELVELSTKGGGSGSSHSSTMIIG